MPTYEYECTKCGHTFEEFKAMSAPRRQRCPLCRAKVERVIGGAAIMFKGSGFYVTDSRRQDSAHRSATDKGAGNSADVAANGSEGSARSGAGEKSGVKANAKAEKPTGDKSTTPKNSADKN